MEVNKWLRSKFPELAEVANGYFFRRSFTDPGSFSMREVAANVLPRVPKSATVLDVGCGTGTWLLYLHEHGYVNSRGIDIDRYGTVRAANALLQEYGHDSAASQGSLWDVSDRYDVITIFDCLYDLTPKLANVAEFFTFMARLAPKFLAFDYYVTEDQPKPTRGYQRVPSVVDVGQRHGFNPTEIFVRLMGGREIALYVFRHRT